MRVYPEKLAQDLERQLRPVYLLSGDEPLLIQECADLVRAAARRGGCSERRVLDTSDRGFNWQDLDQDASSLSLFAEQRLLELRIPNGKPGAEGSKALLAYLDNPSPGDVLLIVAGRIDKASTNSKWYKALDQAGATVQLWPVKPDELPRWLNQRAQSLGLRLEREAVEILAERVEGNLLAAVQELEKLRLIAGDNTLNARQVTEAVADSARYNPFALADVALAGRATDCLRMLHGLRGEGAQPPALLWSLVRELQGLRDFCGLVEAGHAPGQVLAQARVWKSRQPVLQAALERHTVASCDHLLALAGRVDGSIKGYASGNPWELLDLLLLGLAGRGETPLPV